MKLEEMIAERSKVLKALEERDLTPEKRKDGWAVYDDLTAKIQEAFEDDARKKAAKLRQGTML